jgi:hypothetical protein
MFSNLFGSIAAALFGDISVGGISLSKIGRSLGSTAGNFFDDSFKDSRKNIVSPTDLDNIIITSDNAQDTVPLLYGTVRVGGYVLWVSPVQTHVNKSHLFSGKWGLFPTRGADTYIYSISVAIALCEGTIDRVINIYANDRLLSTDIVTRFYKGDDTQTLDPLIQSFEGSDYIPFRNTAYIVIENIPIDLYNKHLPNFTFDAVKGSNPKIEDSIKALCLIPASGEFVYATDLVQRDAEFSPIYENVHTPSFDSDFSICVKNLKSTYKNLKNVSMVVGWFFDHTDPALLNIKPAVETRNKNTTPLVWSVAGYNRQTAWLVSSYNNTPAYGGTPCDEAVKQGIIKLYQAGYKVTFYPFLFGDIIPSNPQNQPAYPWRGRITPTGSDTQKQSSINRFFDSAGYTTMILHYANVCKQINDIYPNAVDLFVIGSELRGLTQTKIGNIYPAVEKLKTLAGQVRAILGTGVKLTYGADWSEGGSFKAPDGSLDFPLDSLWASSNIDYVAYDWYPPLTDWREGGNHLDTALANNDTDLTYLASRIEGGEGYDWYYATDSDRNNQTRTAITDGAYNEPWVYRIKDIRSRWQNYHYRRNGGGVRLTTPTSWIPQSKKIIFTEIGCPAVNKGGNAPNVFPDPKSSENAVPPFSNGQRDDFIQRAVLKAYLDYWANETTMIDTDRTSVWCVDARPYPIFPARSDIWGDSDLFATGHWIDGRGGFTNLKDIITDISERAGLQVQFENFDNVTIDGFIINKNMSAGDMLVDLATIFDLRLTNQNDIVIVTNGEIGFALNETNIVRLVGRGGAGGAGGDNGGNIVNKNAINTIIQTQFAVNILKTDLETNNFIYENHNNDVPTRIQTYFLNSQQAGQKATLEVSTANDIHNQSIKMVLPIAAFDYDLKPYIQQYLYKLRAAYHTIQLIVHNQAIRAGDNVSFNNKTYCVTGIKQTNHLMRLSLELCSSVSKPSVTQTSISKQTDYALAVPVIKYVTIDSIKYIGLSVKPYYKEYFLSKKPVGGSVTEYVSIIKPIMIYGTTATDFYNRPIGIVDTTHDLWIVLPNGEGLSSVTAADTAKGYNHLAVYNQASQLWERISFETAVLVDSVMNKYQLSKISRGLNNTANAMGNPVIAGATLVIMNNALIQIDNGFTYKIE